MSVSIDPALRLRPTDCFLEYVKSVKDDEELPKALRNATKESQLEMRDVRWVFKRRAQDAGDGLLHFHELVSGCEVVLPTPVYPERNPELEARVQRLRVEQENRQYRMMTSGINSPGSSQQNPEEPISKQFKELNNYLLLVIQLVVSVVTSFFAGYLAPYYFYGVTDVGKRLIVGIIFAFIVAIADLYFIMRHFLLSEGVINLEAMEKKYT